MYKSLSEMEPGQKFFTINYGEREISFSHNDGLKGKAVDIHDAVWQDSDVDWLATNALYAQDAYTAEIHEVMQKQLAKGKAKYGLTLENGTVGIIESIDHAIEEVVDQLYYLVHLKAQLKAKGE